MGLITQTTPPTADQAAANKIRDIAREAVRHLAQSEREICATFWNPPGGTPPGVAAQLGTDGVAFVSLVQNMTAFIQAQCALFGIAPAVFIVPADYQVPPGHTLQTNGDGTITVT